jgi:hypothetical protein
MSTNAFDETPDGGYGEDFASNIAAEIGGELFGGGDAPEADAGKTAALPGDTPAESAEAPAAQRFTEASPAEQAQAAQAAAAEMRALPKSWKKDMEGHWKTLPKEVHDYVYAREADVMRGLQQYQEGYKQWDQLLKPYGGLFQQNPDVNPVQLMQNLMNTHLQLLNPSLPADQKAQIGQRILESYGIKLAGQPAAPADENSAITALQQRLDRAEQIARQAADRLTARERAEYDAGVKEWESKIETFASDPKNKFFADVGNDILRFVQTGAASSLEAAYELACYANPVVRAKILAEQQAPAQATTAKPATAARDASGRFVNLDGEPPARRSARSGTIDQTIDAVVARAYNPKANL